MNDSTQTVRFAKVIEQSGKPKFISLWGKPDTAFLAAVNQNRVMTIKIHPVGNRAEFGTVGFQKEKNVLYLLFPESLHEFKRKRVVGIKLELVEEEGVTGKPKPTHMAQKEIRKAIPPPEKKFTIIIRSTAIVDTSYDIKALDKKTAVAKAQRVAERESIDFLQGKIEQKVLRITPSIHSRL